MENAEAALRSAFQRIEELERQLTITQQHQQQQLQQQAHKGDGFRPRKPSTFSGERWDANAVEAWIQEVETYFFLAGVPETKQAVIAASFFTGPAALWWRMRIPDDGLGAAETWNQLRLAVRQHFKPARAEANARDRLAKLRQKGRLTTYVMRFRELIVQIPSMTDDEKLHRFLEGLTDLRMRRELDYRNPTTWQQAVEQALRFESIYNNNFGRQDGVVIPRPNPGPPQGEAMELGAVRAAAPAPPGRKCFRCGDPTHVVRNCPQRRSFPPQQEN